MVESEPAHEQGLGVVVPTSETFIYVVATTRLM